MSFLIRRSKEGIQTVPGRDGNPVGSKSHVANTGLFREQTLREELKKSLAKGPFKEQSWGRRGGIPAVQGMAVERHG